LANGKHIKKNGLHGGPWKIDHQSKTKGTSNRGRGTKWLKRVGEKKRHGKDTKTDHQIRNNWPKLVGKEPSLNKGKKLPRGEKNKRTLCKGDHHGKQPAKKNEVVEKVLLNTANRED